MQPVSMPRNSYPAFWRPVPFGRLPSPYPSRNGASLGQARTIIDSPLVAVLTDAVAATASIIYGITLIRTPKMEALGWVFMVIGGLAGIKGVVDVYKVGR